MLKISLKRRNAKTPKRACREVLDNGVMLEKMQSVQGLICAVISATPKIGRNRDVGIDTILD